MNLLGSFVKMINPSKKSIGRAYVCDEFHDDGGTILTLEFDSGYVCTAAPSEVELIK